MLLLPALGQALRAAVVERLGYFGLVVANSLLNRSQIIGEMCVITGSSK